MEVVKVRTTAAKSKVPVINELAPRWPFRLLVCGSTGCGKTNAVVDLLMRYIPWQVLWVYAKHMGEAWQSLQAKVEAREKRLKRPISFWETSLENAVPVDTLSPTNRNVVVFDDFIMDREHQPTIADYFVRGRHRNCSLVYITQSYYDVPKIVRNNCSHYMIFRGYNGSDETHLWKDLGSGMRKDEFAEYLREATRRPHGFAFIDTDPARPELRWRIGFDRLVLPDNMVDAADDSEDDSK